MRKQQVQVTEPSLSGRRAAFQQGTRSAHCGVSALLWQTVNLSWFTWGSWTKNSSVGESSIFVVRSGRGGGPRNQYTAEDLTGHKGERIKDGGRGG